MANEQFREQIWPTIPYSSLLDQMHLLNNRKKEEKRRQCRLIKLYFNIEKVLLTHNYNHFHWNKKQNDEKLHSVLKHARCLTT